MLLEKQLEYQRVTGHIIYDEEPDDASDAGLDSDSDSDSHGGDDDALWNVCALRGESAATATSKMSTWLPRWLLFVGQRSSESFWAGLDHFVVWRRFARLHAARCSTERRVLGRSTIWRSTRTSGSTPARRPYFGSIRSGSHRAWSSHFCTARLGLRGRCAAADQFCCLHCIAVTTIHQVLCVRAGCCPTRS